MSGQDSAMERWLKKLGTSLKYTFLHPQWLSNRYHKSSAQLLKALQHSLVLEIGSGDSRLDAVIDSSTQLIKLDYPDTNRHYDNRPDIFANAEKLPVGNDSMDAVLLLEVAEHVTHDVKTVREIYRVLKPGGKLYFSAPFIYPMHDQPHDYRRYTLYGIRQLLGENRFNIDKIVAHGNSIVTSFQMINLSILELCRLVLITNHIAGLLIVLLFYPICLSMNILACLGFPFTRLNASCLGYFVIATKAPGASVE